MDNRIDVLVTGATGKQGGALAYELLRRKHRVRALTRNPGSPAAKKLASAGAKLHEGHFDDSASVRRAAKGADVAFVMTTPFEEGVEAEQRQGKAAIEALGDVPHIVLSSVASADQNTGIPHFESKRIVEEHLEDTGTPYSIVGPAFFMENYMAPWILPDLQEGKLVQALPADRELQMISTADIGSMVADIIEQRDDYIGHRIDLATDAVTGTRAAEALSQATGTDIRYVMQPLEQAKAANPDMGKMFEWFNKTGYSVDLAALRSQFPRAPWLTIETWSKRQDWSVLHHAVRRQT